MHSRKKKREDDSMCGEIFKGKMAEITDALTYILIQKNLSGLRTFVNLSGLLLR